MVVGQAGWDREDEIPSSKALSWRRVVTDARQGGGTARAAKGQGPALAGGSLHGPALSIFPQSWRETPAAVLKNNK